MEFWITKGLVIRISVVTLHINKVIRSFDTLWLGFFVRSWSTSYEKVPSTLPWGILFGAFIWPALLIIISLFTPSQQSFVLRYNNSFLLIATSALSSLHPEPVLDRTRSTFPRCHAQSWLWCSSISSDPPHTLQFLFCLHSCMPPRFRSETGPLVVLFQ